MTTKPRSISTRSVDRFLDAVVAGVGVPAELFAAGVVLDAALLAAMAADGDAG